MNHIPVTPMVYVLDACSQIAFLRREPGADVIDGLLSDIGNQCFTHAVNLCEVYYDVLRSDDIFVARQAVADLTAAGIQIREDMDTLFWQEVGNLKVNPGRMSLADCFALALSIRMGAMLVTSDHHEFDRIAELGLCQILFIR